VDLAAVSPTPIFAVSSGIGAKDTRCAKGPKALKKDGIDFHLAVEGNFFQWIDIPLTKEDSSPLPAAITHVCRSVADATQLATAQDQFFALIGGDHSNAIGTWSGVARALEDEGDVGLIWIDAHLDSHTPKTSPSGAYHGMPLACLLGYGDGDLTSLSGPSPAIRPQNLCILGARSFEQEEHDLLMSLGVRIFFMDEINTIGFETAFKTALEIAASDTAGFGLSLDLDGIDPKDAPGVGSPEANGIRTEDLLEALSQLNPTLNFLGMEIAEFNPEKDPDGKTTTLIYQLLSATLPKKESSS